MDRQLYLVRFTDILRLTKYHLYCFRAIGWLKRKGKMKKKLTSDDDIVEWVVEEAFVKDEHKHRPNCNDPI